MQRVVNPHDGLGPESIAVLRERADRLRAIEHGAARAGDPGTDRTESYVCFRLLDERYGLPLTAVSEVFPLRNIVPIPGSPRHLLGLTRLRGKVLALVDLRQYWRGSTVGHSDSDLAVLVEDDDTEYGLVCTDVLGLLDVAAGSIEEVPRNIPAQLAACLRGFTADETMLISSRRLQAQEGFLVLQGKDEG